MTQIFTSKTVEEAKELAARTFGVPEEDIEFEVIEEPKKGLFGLMKKGEAKVKATYIPASVEEPEPQRSESTISDFSEIAESDKSEAVITDFSEVDESSDMSESAIPDESESVIPDESESEIPDESESVIPDESESVIPDESESVIPDESESAISDESESAIPDESESVIPDESESTSSDESASAIQPDDALITGEPSASALEKIEKAKEYLTAVLSAMGIQAELEVNAGSESAIIEIVTPNSGAIIGKRGETLDSLQYLTFMAANRVDKEYYRIILNTANYRERRRKTLEELAAKIAKNVLRTHRSTTLEPMNPYERRIIHSAIAQIEGVNSKSIGEEPYRKVVISSNDKPVKSNKRRNYHDKPRRNYHGRRDGAKRDEDTPPTRISMDSMKTSFERDYKRPKPEDDLNAGLYGKIEF